MELSIAFQQSCQFCNGYGEHYFREDKRCTKCVNGAITVPIDADCGKEFKRDLIDQIGEEWANKVRDVLLGLVK